MKKTIFLPIFKTKKTVFSFKEILLDSEEKNPQLLRRRLSYYIKNHLLYPIRRGLYAKDENYDKWELATKILTPSYISFETVLTKAGIIFQYYETIFLASYQTKEISCDNNLFNFRKIKDIILTDPIGIEAKENYSIATPERALLDTLYLNKDYYFDNLSQINWDKIFHILPIYGGNKRLEKKINNLFTQSKNM